MPPILPYQRQEDPFLSFFDNVAAAMSVTLLDGTMVKVNRAYSDFLGYSEAELLKMKVLDFTHPDDREKTTARFREVEEKKQTVAHYEKRYLRKDGRVVWGLVSTSWVMEGPGPTPYCLGLVQDITARKEMERSLRESEELYRTLVENIDLGINLIDENRRIIKVNRATNRLMAKPGESLVGQECFRAFEKRERICDHCPGTRSMERGEPATVITEGIRGDGSRAVARLRTFPVQDADGKARKFVEVVEDITERVEVRDALRESERRFRAIFENAGAGLYTLSPAGRFLQVNRALCRFLGYTQAELLDMTLEEVTHAEDVALSRRMIKEALSYPGYNWHYEKRYRRKDGSLLWAHVSGAWQMDDAGRPAYAIGMIQDITERKHAEEALQESETHYRRLFEANPHPMWIVDSETCRFLAVNDAAVAHYGYSRKEFLGMSINDIRPEGEMPPLSADGSGDCAGMDQRLTHHRCRDGRLIEVEINAHNIDFGNRKARVVLVHDVTEKRRAEERMRLDAAALRSTRDAILITDRAPRIISVNPAFTEITGYGETDVLGEHPSLLSSSRNDEGVFEAIWTTLLQSNHWQGEIWGRRKDGEMFPGWLSISAVHNAAGEPTHFVGAISDLTKLRKSEERLRYLADYDALTDLPKRQVLETVLQHALERARRDKGRLALVFLDLDRFKTVNESFGHKVGDDLLISVVRRLRNRIRKEDTLARLMGDGFALILEGIEDQSDVEVAVRDLLAALDAPFVLPKGQLVYLRASIGISLFPQDGETTQDLLRGAEAAVNLAKERGGAQFCYGNAELNTQARRRLELQSELGQALEREEFLLYFQPKVDLRDGRIVGAEALLRWNRPGKGLVPPQQFIPIAEKTGMIVPLGAWVLENACRHMRRWRDAGLGEIRIAVNVSARQFRSGQLEELVAATLKNQEVDPQCLMLELTESMLMDEPEEAITRIAALRRIGVRISLDDFGTGYSSLGYLSRFPIDQLKIDRSFITDIVTDPNAATIATSIIALAHRMQLRVVAEGVETEAQLGYLRQNGCDEMQGFYFSKPVPAEKFTALVFAGKSLPAANREVATPTLLIVDDEPHILSALRRVLAEENYRVLTAGTGREGLELLAKNTVQVIISDQHMPEMIGSEFLRRVKTLYPNVVRMILSQYADLPTVSQAVNDGAPHKFLPKPWDNDRLRRQIREAFSFYETSQKPEGALPAGC